MFLILIADLFHTLALLHTLYAPAHHDKNIHRIKPMLRHICGVSDLYRSYSDCLYKPVSYYDCIS